MEWLTCGNTKLLQELAKAAFANGGLVPVVCLVLLELFKFIYLLQPDIPFIPFAIFLLGQSVPSSLG